MTAGAQKLLKTFEPMIVDVGNVLCSHFIDYFGYKPETCPGIVENEFHNAILPAITDGIFDDEVMCNFLLNWCDSGHWAPIDLDKWIQDLLESKPQ